MESNKKVIKGIIVLFKAFKNYIYPAILTVYSFFTFWYGITITSLDDISNLEWLSAPFVQFLTANRTPILLVFLFISLLFLGIYIWDQHRNAIQMEKKADLDFMKFMTHYSKQWDELVRNTLEKSNDSDAIKYYSDIEAKSTVMLDDISKFLTSRCHDKKINTCIKMIEPQSLQQMLQTGKLEDCNVFTLVRGGDLDKSRREFEIGRLKEVYYHERLNNPYRPESIGQISDFYTMMEASSQFADFHEPLAAEAFACRNIVRYRNRIDRFNAFIAKNPSSTLEFFRPQRTTSKDWWKNYNSTVFVPIRVLLGDLPEPWKQCVANGHWRGKYLVIGFFCIDHNVDLPKRMINDLTDYCKQFADIFSRYLFSVADEGLHVKWEKSLPKKRNRE